MKNKSLIIVAVLAGLMLGGIDTGAQTVLNEQEATKMIELRNLTATQSAISGEVANRTPHTVRDIQMLIQFHWLWKDEFSPGTDSPGRLDSLKIAQEIKSGESLPFRYTPDPPLPDRKDGWFDPEVTIGGFTVVVPAADVTSR